MKVQALKVTMLLLVLLCTAPAPSETLGGWSRALERQLRAGAPGEHPWPPADGGDNLPQQGSSGSHPLAGAWEVIEEVPSGSRSPSKAMTKSARSSGDQDLPRKPRSVPPQPSHSRSPGLSHLLKGYGKFNGDTHSCPGIQSRPCQKPSDCSGCLGLYTCKLPAGTCHLKAVSRQRGRFLQSIQRPEGHGILFILGKHGSI
ncbi:uncharacterized protein [Patagioenas fasciata]|uniref:uncharacterized protein n=1 Tax=Patagioenas fasciata TaxID=372321 RepID=UPI0032E925B1